LWHVKKLVQKYKLASLFGAKFIVKVDYCNAAFTSSASANLHVYNGENLYVLL